MSRTNIDIDDELVERAMRRYNLRTKREAVNFALRQLVGDSMTLDEALAMEGSGWEGDLEEIRSSGTIERLDDLDLDRLDHR
ncbi:MAG: type II toxin-antitoxin system VapB family antitoxin [Acidimicrobiales bacterium]